ncbi:MAG: WbqC family protein [Prevotella sp.]|nr:WbqC family protein [Prevotella sp.]
MSTALLSSAYFAPIQWYQKLNRYDLVKVEAYDSFIKQTFRNRCIIATANGPQTLSVPVERPACDEMGNFSKCLMKDVRISEHGNWRHSHWNALQSAYGESPFFEFLADDIRLFFERKWTFLYDFNMEICAKICDLIDIKPHIEPTTKFVPAYDSSLSEISDFREAIHPKHPLEDTTFTPKPYYQVYGHKHGFIPNLSIIDLLFNMGNESIFYL